MKTFTILLTALIVGVAVNAQNTWMEIHSTTDGAALNCVDFIDAEHGVAVGNSGTAIATSNAGETWESLDTGYDVDLEGVKYYAEDTIIISGNSGTLIRTTDGGDTWSSVDHPGESANLYDIDIDTASGKGLIGGSGNLVMWTEDAGASWEYIDGGYMNDFNGAFMANSDFGLVIGRNSIFQPLLQFTQNGGESFSGLPVYPVIDGTANEGTGFDAYFFNADDGFLAGSTWSGGGFITTEVAWGSSQWEAMELPQPIYAIDFANDNLGVVAGWEGYMAETNNGGATWHEVTGNFSREPGVFNDAKIYESTGYAVTENGVIYKRVSTTNVENDPNPVKDFLIYPNPTGKGYTNLRLNLTKSSDIHVSIKDVTGRVVREISQKEFPAGKQQIRVSTSSLNSGVYMVVVTNGKYQVSRTMAVR
ncbi:MAG: T9SS type A sorting domain-containing protein [Bacteroidales bacterium]|nr:T9SS type A sorting domain-containing protein [Bacteroidales bacterium]MCF8333132.1 T9SS type A sorting domain-containing protein [Bacteroidales bacterium]